MATESRIRSRFVLAYALAVAVLSTIAVALSLTLAPEPRIPSAPVVQPWLDADDDDAPGSALPVTGKPAPDAIAAAFTRRSYGIGAVADLHIATPAPQATLSVYRAGAGNEGVMQGARVGSPVRLSHATSAQVRVGRCPTGLYYARLTAPNGHFGYAPFVVRPRHLGEHRVAVVLPTNTWQAYNYYDANGDRRPDSWYASASVGCVLLTRPFLDHGVPPHYTGYDRGFVRWLARSGKNVDFLTDDDIDGIATGDRLAAKYDLIVFSGHEEYVTAHAYDVVERYRNLGGNLMFLSANNFFYRITGSGESICRSARWRDIGRPEARLVGIQYVDWYQERYENRPYIVAGAGSGQWAFRGTELAGGTSFGQYGIEIDARTTLSPHGIQVLARIPDIFGPGKSAEMTYYTTPRGAKVFAAGVINFGGTALWPGVTELLANVWSELSSP
ncbi:MAG: N,N-dimethylformamidase beta subunit family domain-containing protein [Gaiellaceae bacterium]